MKLRRVFAVVVLPVAFGVLSGVALAHHSKAQYGKEQVTTTGTVVEYRFRNPHVFVVWDVKIQGGKNTQWVGEMGSVTTTIADGMSKDSLKPGDKVTVTFFPSKTPGSSEALVVKIVRGDGIVLVQGLAGYNVKEP